MRAADGVFVLLWENRAFSAAIFVYILMESMQVDWGLKCVSKLSQNFLYRLEIWQTAGSTAADSNCYQWCTDANQYLPLAADH